MRFCKRCYASEKRQQPVSSERIVKGHRAFRCEKCGCLSGEAIAVTSDATVITDVGTIPSDRFNVSLRKS